MRRSPEARIVRARHQGLIVAQRYAMSDALWARVAAVLTAVDPAPPADARALLDAIVYRALTGATWDELPAGYPPPPDVAACAERWRALGLLKRLEPVLLLRLDS
jgi:transposase